MSNFQLIPSELIEKSDKILFIAHLAIGDFTYLQSSLREFFNAFPHIAIHVWVDELRRTSKSSEWDHLKKYSLYDWIEACPFIQKLYKETYSPALYRKSITEAKSQDYPIVVSLGLLRRKSYARLARKISPAGFVAGQVKRSRPYDILSWLAYRKLDARLPAYKPADNPAAHISDIYAGWFQLLFGLEIPPEKLFPFVDIPKHWMSQANQQFELWGITTEKVIFLNSFSKGVQRNWPLGRIVELINAMRKHGKWRSSVFIVNVVPEQLDDASKFFSAQALPQVHLFSAVENFFQLPAVLSLCNLIISVETAIMHLANAVHVPVIALMRKTSPEWKPIDAKNSIIITVEGENDWVDTIQTGQVMAVLEHEEYRFFDRNGKQHV